MSIKNVLQIAYKNENSSLGTNDNFMSEFNMLKEFTPAHLALFLKMFFYKIPFIDRKIIDWMLPHPQIDAESRDDEVPPDDQPKRKKSKEVNKVQSFFESIPENIENIANDKKNVEYFKQQLDDNPELLKEAFKLFLEDTLDS